MTYEEILKKVEEAFGSADVSNYEDHLALQINIVGEGAGIFYTEINQGKLYIAPFDYKDNNAVLIANGSDIIDIFSGKITEAEALASGKLTVEGDLAKALSIQPYISVKPAKTTRKRAASKKTAAKAEAEVTLSETVKKSCRTKTAEKAVKTAKTATKAAAKSVAKAVKETSAKTAKKAKTENRKG
ncbi:MAG: SCP2 sterol-binding domain-containing protein [Oscillospiraceae bacterium]|nr:SCP2 sterol-binding domain-containing protein [Oscillospiraceae bacterium]